MRTSTSLTLIAGLSLSAVACGDLSDPERGDPTIVAPFYAQVPPECDTRSLSSVSRSFYSSPEQQLGAEALRAMEAACAADDTDRMVSIGWGLLSLIEAAVDAGVGGAPADGTTLANGVIAFMIQADAGLGEPNPAPVLPADLGPTGIFAVRGPGAGSVVAHGPVGFVHFADGLPVANQAWWGLETSAGTWAVATRAPMILLYGSSDVGTPLSPRDRSIGDLQLELNSFPDVDGFGSDQVHVAVCYSETVPLPHVGDLTSPALLGRLQREGTLLQAYRNPGFHPWCPPEELASGGFASFVRGVADLLGRALLPSPLHAAMMSDREASSTGGTPIDFSRFAAVAANTQGYLEFVVPPTDGFVGQGLSPAIQVRALSGSGTEMELVEVTLHVAGNSGSPAGATFCSDRDCTLTELTMEAPDGYGTVAMFDGATLWKPGGYIVCATATLPGDPDYTFTDTCSEMIHIKN